MGIFVEFLTWREMSQPCLYTNVVLKSKNNCNKKAQIYKIDRNQLKRCLLFSLGQTLEKSIETMHGEVLEKKTFSFTASSECQRCQNYKGLQGKYQICNVVRKIWHQPKSEARA